MISIITATYNRAQCLERLYNSLKRQQYTKFEWIVVDDGSDDNTEDIIKNFISENNLDIKYYKKNNGGKHTAINLGIKKCTGDICVFVDSDDYLEDYALNFINKEFKLIENKDDIIGISGSKRLENGQLIGTISENIFDECTSFSYRYELNIKGDKLEIFKAKILKDNLFPEFSGEKFLTEAILYNRLADLGYKLKWFNKTLCVCEYRDDGLTANGYYKFIKSWKGYKLYVNEMIKYKEIPKILKLKLILIYIKLSFLKKFLSRR